MIIPRRPKIINTPFSSQAESSVERENSFFLFPISEIPAALLRLQIAIHVAERVGVVSHSMADELVDPERLAELHVPLHIGGDLGVLKGDGISRSDLLRQTQSGSHQGLIGDDPADQADLFRLMRRQILPG